MRRRTTLDLGRLCVVILATVVVCSPGWTGNSGGESDGPDAAARVLTPGLETGVLRATPTAALGGESDRSQERRSHPSLAVMGLMGLLGVLAPTIAGLWGRRNRFQPGRFSISFGSRAPPELLPA
jgi:hypothetical protein